GALPIYRVGGQPVLVGKGIEVAAGGGAGGRARGAARGVGIRGHQADDEAGGEREGERGVLGHRGVRQKGRGSLATGRARIDGCACRPHERRRWSRKHKVLLPTAWASG